MASVTQHVVIPGHLNILCLILCILGFLSVAPVITELFNHFMYDVAFTFAARVVL